MNKKRKYTEDLWRSIFYENLYETKDETDYFYPDKNR